MMSSKPSIEIQPAGICRCKCGNEYAGNVIVREGHENMDCIIGIVRESGAKAAKKVVEQTADLGEYEKDEIVSMCMGELETIIDSYRQDSLWKGVFGIEKKNTPCPKCGIKTVPDIYYFFLCDCGSRKIVSDKTSPTVKCDDCGIEYEADYRMVKNV
jgi:hypothetical protein